MTNSWDFSHLKQRLIDIYGIDYCKKAMRSLESIIENQGFCDFHYHEIKRLRNESLVSLQKETNRSRELLRRAVYQDDSFSIAVSAHTNALLRCLHSNSDLLAHFIYFCFQIEDDKNINLKHVRKKILGFDGKETNSLQDLLFEFESNIERNDHRNKNRSSSDYWYLDALVNHTKHWSNILPKLSYSLLEEGENLYKWHFESFYYKEAHYPEKDVFSFIEREYDRQSGLLPQIIKEVDLLNAQIIDLEL